MVREWDLGVDDPLALRLAADVRWGVTDYGDDHIWELDLAALVLQTQYGRRGWGRIGVVERPFTNTSSLLPQLPPSQLPQ